MEARVRREAVERKRYHSTCYSKIFLLAPLKLWHGSLQPLFLSKTSNTDRRKCWLLIPSSMPFCPVHPRHDLHWPCFPAHSPSTLASALKHFSSLPTALASEPLNASLIFTHCASSSNQFPLIGQKSQRCPLCLNMSSSPQSNYALTSYLKIQVYHLPSISMYMVSQKEMNTFKKVLLRNQVFQEYVPKLVEFIFFP